MDDAVSIKRRLDAMKQIYDAGIRTVCFIAPVFPGITDFEAIFHQVRNQCDLIWLENLNLRGGFKKDIMDYIGKKYPDLVPLYDAIYNKRDRSYFRGLEDQAETAGERKQLSLRGQRAALRTGRAWAPCHCRLLFTMRKCVARKTAGDATPKIICEINGF